MIRFLNKRRSKTRKKKMMTTLTQLTEKQKRILISPELSKPYQIYRMKS